MDLLTATNRFTAINRFEDALNDLSEVSPEFAYIATTLRMTLQNEMARVQDEHNKEVGNR